MTEELILKRKSLQCWKELLNKLNKGLTKKEILMLIHTEIDNKNGYRSQTNSDKSLESLNYLLKGSPAFVTHEIIGKKDTKW